jgi:hypothetical protein
MICEVCGNCPNGLWSRTKNAYVPCWECESVERRAALSSATEELIEAAVAHADDWKSDDHSYRGTRTELALVKAVEAWRAAGGETYAERKAKLDAETAALAEQFLRDMEGPAAEKAT